MTKTLLDLNERLFDQLDRLSAPDADATKIEQETVRAAAMVKIAGQIIRNAELHLRAVDMAQNYGDAAVNNSAPMIAYRGEKSA